MMGEVTLRTLASLTGQHNPQRLTASWMAEELREWLGRPRPPLPAGGNEIGAVSVLAPETWLSRFGGGGSA